MLLALSWGCFSSFVFLCSHRFSDLNVCWHDLICVSDKRLKHRDRLTCWSLKKNKVFTGKSGIRAQEVSQIQTGQAKMQKPNNWAKSKTKETNKYWKATSNQFAGERRQDPKRQELVFQNKRGNRLAGCYSNDHSLFSLPTSTFSSSVALHFRLSRCRKPSRVISECAPLA